MLNYFHYYILDLTPGGPRIKDGGFFRCMTVPFRWAWRILTERIFAGWAGGRVEIRTDISFFLLFYKKTTP